MKTCNNCAYRMGGFDSGGHCLRTGEYLIVQRHFPNEACDRQWSGWAPRPSLVMRIVGRIASILVGARG